jgi:hypothetical protein
MAIVVVGQAPDQGTYDEVTSRVLDNEQLPAGCLDHIAGPSGGGFRVITVWESEEQYQQFRDEKLLPAIQEVSGGNVEGPDAEVQPIHKHITA